ncbi:imidazolonepropionase [Candidatus Neomarinimicrobiota bacterium]
MSIPTGNIKLTNIGQLATFDSTTNSVRIHQDVELLIQNDKIESIGKKLKAADKVIDCRGQLITPGFVDPHTHPVFVNGRQKEFQMRIAGASYQEIAAQGGGIQSSIYDVRKASVADLIKAVTNRMDRFLVLGTTTIEAKSGYGLDLDSELKSLAVLDQVRESHSIDIIPTFMGAHAFPPEYKNDRDGYVEYICSTMIPKVKEQDIAIFCDVFCEEGYFNVHQSEKILLKAKEHGLTPRLHADEFKDSNAAELAGRIGAVSADHLMAVSDKGIDALSKSGVIGILLPGTTFFLGSSSWAPAKKLKENGVEIALATDFNPGSCFIQSMPFIISLACLYLNITIEEAFKSATYNAAKSLMVEDTVGSLEPGKKADLIWWNLNELIEIPYHVTDVPITNVMKSGRWI